MTSAAQADSFKIPERFFGDLCDEFYTAVGQITNLSALLEGHLIDLYQALANLQQDEGSQMAASDLCAKAQAEVRRLLADDLLGVGAAGALQEYLNAAESALKARNVYVHNKWSAKPDGAIYGWRPGRHGRVSDSARQKGIQEVGISKWYTEDASRITICDVQAVVGSLIELNRRWPRIYSLVSGRRHAQRISE